MYKHNLKGHYVAPDCEVTTIASSNFFCASGEFAIQAIEDDNQGWSNWD